MSTIQHNFSLKQYNTFGISQHAQHLVIATTIAEVQQAIHNYKHLPKNILGGGSNILLTQDIPGLTIKNEIKGITISDKDDDYILLHCGAGEAWHTVVQYAVQHNYQGIENLSLIPGTVGAAPIQNIGAYGVELKEVFYNLNAINIATGQLETFDKTQCAFGYRDSIFKNELKNKYVIVQVTLQLNKKPKFNTSYGAIQQVLSEQGISELSCQAISNAVIHIRQSKLPDPAKIGNGGSFFKNPTITHQHYKNLLQQWPTLPGYTAAQGLTKVPAGWLIEQCGLKGYRQGDAGVHELQALVLVNYGQASGQQILLLSQSIIDNVHNKFGILLEREVNVW
jgi:UDP-N-acetylmuramate dehydrogenase